MWLTCCHAQFDVPTDCDHGTCAAAPTVVAERGPGQDRLRSHFGWVAVGRSVPITARKRHALAGLLLIAGTLCWTPVSGADGDGGVLAPGVVALVDAQPISEQEFAAYFHQFARGRFYHGTAPADQLAALKVEVVERMILHRLLVREADRRGIGGEPAEVDEKMAAYREQLGEGERREAFEREASQVRERLLGLSRASALELSVRRVAEPSEEVLANYYRENLDLFTTPPQERVAVILISVGPWEAGEAWDLARERAETLAEELKAGADFAELAKGNSDHESAASGGDMGYMHRGTIAGPAQQALDALESGQVSPPVLVLEGYVLLRLVDRLAVTVREFHEVRERVLELYTREQSERQWREFTSNLRGGAEVMIAESIYDLPNESPDGKSD